MSNIRQYFETDFDHTLRVQLSYTASPLKNVCTMLCDPNAALTFFAFYLEEVKLAPADLELFLGTLKYGKTQLALAGGLTFPSSRTFHGGLRIHNTDPFEIEYQFFGDPCWHDLFSASASNRVFVYTECTFTPQEIMALQEAAASFGLNLQIRDTTYARERTLKDQPQAFISHDSRDKDSIARPIAQNLNSKSCAVWYDEFSLKLGDNLRESIERGLKECKKCVLILSPYFIGNQGWGRKEFESIFTREILEGSNVVLPIWFGVTKQDVYDYSPALLNVKGLDWNAVGADEVCRQIYIAISGAA